MKKRNYPLEGVRVVDFSWRAVGPVSARMLAWHGAEVIRIESPSRLCGMRQSAPLSPGKTGVNVGGLFNNWNSSKLSITLNLKNARSKEVAKRLVAVSDVAVENFGSGVMQRLGLGYSELVKVRPDLIMISHSMMGMSGPWQPVAGHGPNIQAMAGLDHLTGYPDRDPIGTGLAYTDFVVNPFHSSRALLAALHHRNRTGEGQYVDLAQYESVINATGTAILDYSANGRVQIRTGNRIPYAAPHGVYRCQGDDRWCAVSVFTDDEWRAFCEVIGRPEIASDPRFASLSARKENEDALDVLVEKWTSLHPPQEVMLQLQAAGVAAGVVQDGEDLLMRDPQMRDRGHYHKVDHPEAGRTTLDGPPFRFSISSATVFPAPLLGEHNDYVFKEILGMTEEEINQGYVDGLFD